MDLQRGKNFSEKEKSDLLDIIFLYRDIIENKVTDGLSNSKKDKPWTTITQKFNTNKTDLRTEKTLRNCWDNIKRNTNKYYATLKREIHKTENTLYERAKDIMGETAVHGLLNLFDSDCVLAECLHDGEHINKKEAIGNKENIYDLEKKNENDPAEVFSYLINNDEITDWKSWDPNKLKSKISPPLKDKEDISPVPIISKQDNIIKLAAVENISIADARRIINDQGLSTRYGSRLDSQDFPRLNSKTPYNSSSSPSFVSSNPFNLLEAEDQDYGRILYVEAAGSRPARTTQQASSYNGNGYHHLLHGLTNHLNTSQKRVNNPGYDRRAHQEALVNPQDAYGYSNARGMAY
ncbi:UPF0439 protein C9orf30 like protein [Trachymyrmex cornetzi]|uniref:Regulatory protein zeste n=1 Tax=Trachymyrmex cornetzi TaxID=471704 RepID=A0A151JQE6_9HYME|nr:UPF0439 protein C9orf30 like protein [Trachymyrmex cornetzi]